MHTDTQRVINRFKVYLVNFVN